MGINESFQDVLYRLRLLKKNQQNKRLSQDDVAEITKLSRAYISMLESNKDKNPSVQALAALCKLLGTIGEETGPDLPLDTKKVSQLLSAALGISLDFGFEDDAGPFSPMVEGEIIADASEVWIFTDLLAENAIPGITELTGEALQRGVAYRYLISEHSEWNRCQRRLEENLGAETLKRSDVLAIHCSSPLCYMRVALFDPTERSGRGTVTVGSTKRPRLRWLQPKQVLDTHAKGIYVVQDLLRSGSSQQIDPDLGRVQLLFCAQGVKKR
jgi:transcriptional regulator with XRE-family HTH domain